MLAAPRNTATISLPQRSLLADARTLETEFSARTDELLEQGFVLDGNMISPKTALNPA